MANKITLTTSSYSGRYMQLVCTQTYDIATNKSTINWTLSSIGGSNNYYSTGATYVKINNKTVYEKARVSASAQTFPAAKGSVSGSLTVTHNTDGSLAIPVYLETQIYTTSKRTVSNTWTLDTIPRGAQITSAPDFNDEATSVTINYSNLAGNSVSAVDACIATYNATAGYWADSGASYRSISKTGTSYTFDFTKEPTILTNLRNLVTAADGKLKVRFYLRTTIGDNKLYHYVEKTFSLVDFEPILNPYIADSFFASIGLTGNPNTLIKGYNSMEYEIGATARKGATITNQRITCGNQTTTEPSGYLDDVESNVFVFRAIDSRGTIVEKTITLQMVEPTPLTCRMSASIELEGETTSKITFNVNGEWWSGNFGVANNTVTLHYRLKTGNTYGSWIAITPTLNASNGTYSFNGTLGGLDYKENYTIQVRASDWGRYNSVYSKEIALSTTPVFDYDNTSFNLNVPLTFNGGIEQDYIVEKGTSGIWTYEKWASGKAVCWGISTFNTTTNAAWHTTGVYIGATDTGRVNYPFNFIDKPVEMANLTTGSLATWLYSKSTNGASSTGIYNVARFGSNSNSYTFYINFYIIGRWK